MGIVDDPFQSTTMIRKKTVDMSWILLKHKVYEVLTVYEWQKDKCSKRGDKKDWEETRYHSHPNLST